MSNSVASARVTLSAPGPGNSTISASASILAAFKALACEVVDVPASSTSTFVIAFGSIGTAATLVMIQNNTDGPLAIAVNGGAAEYKVAPGGWFISGADTAPASTPITAISVTVATTGAGSVDSFVFGDPEP